MDKLTYFAFFLQLSTHTVKSLWVLLPSAGWRAPPSSLSSGLPPDLLNTDFWVAKTQFEWHFPAPWQLVCSAPSAHHTSCTHLALCLPHYTLPRSVFTHLWQIMRFLKAGSTSCSHRSPSSKFWHCPENMLLKDSATMDFSPFLEEKKYLKWHHGTKEVVTECFLWRGRKRGREKEREKQQKLTWGNKEIYNRVPAFEELIV